MTVASMGKPVRKADRIDALDPRRAVASRAILLMDIQSMDKLDRYGEPLNR